MLALAFALGAFVSWPVGGMIPAITTALAITSCIAFLAEGHTFSCAAKKGFILVFGWWEYLW